MRSGLEAVAVSMIRRGAFAFKVCAAALPLAGNNLKTIHSLLKYTIRRQM
jgi:hypothetical protein